VLYFFDGEIAAAASDFSEIDRAAFGADHDAIVLILDENTRLSTGYFLGAA